MIKIKSQLFYLSQILWKGPITPFLRRPNAKLGSVSSEASDLQISSSIWWRDV